jgi:hypothetical protein
VAVQVKSRFEGTSMLSKKGAFVAGVRKVAFRPRDDLYLLFVVVNPDAPDFGPVWLVPSHDFDERVKPKPGWSPALPCIGEDRHEGPMVQVPL